jgi:long-chain fatty acid transport protein
VKAQRATPVLFAFAFAFALAAGDLHASPAASGGFGARTRALAGAGTATAEDAAAVFENPSALALAPDTELSFGFASEGYSYEDNGSRAPLARVDTFEFGLVVPGAIRELPFAFGFALALPNGRLSRIRTVAPANSYWPVEQGGAEMVDLGAAIALRPWKPLLLGAGLGYVASLHGAFHITGTAVAVDQFGSEYGSDLNHAVHADLSSSRYPLLGASLVLSDALDLALAFRGASSVEQEIEGVLDGTLVAGQLELPIVYSFRASTTVAYSPAELALGVSYRPRPRSLVALDLAFQAWGGYETPYSNTSSELVADLPPDTGIMLPPPTVGSEPPPAGLENRLVPRLAFEQRFDPAPSLHLAGRLGYAFEPSPVPEDQTATLFLDVDRHEFSLGGGLELSGPGVPIQKLALDAFLAFALGVPRTITAPDGTAHRAEGGSLAGGATLRLVFGSAP